MTLQLIVAHKIVLAFTAAKVVSCGSNDVWSLFADNSLLNRVFASRNQWMHQIASVNSLVGT